MAAWHEHALGAKTNCIATHRARGRLHIGAIFLAMFRLYLDDWELIDSLSLSFLFASPSFRLLLAHSAHHLIEFDAFVALASPRGEIALEVRHKCVGRKTLEEAMHSEELVPRKKLLETPH